MSFFYALLLIFIFIIMLVFAVALKIAFSLDTEKENVKLVLFWLYPFIKVTAEGSMTSPLLTVFLFKKKVYSGRLGIPGQAAGKTGKPGKIGGKTDLILSASASDIRMDIDYGFRDPYITGVTCGSINAASEIADFLELRQNPDFIADEDFIRMDATANINVGNTILNYLKRKSGKR